MPQIYQRKGGEILVNTETTNNQASPSNAVLAGGGFVVAYQDASLLGGDASVSSVKAQRFDANGNKVGGEFLVNTTVTGSQGQPIVAALPSGRFVVTWADLSMSGGDTSAIAVRAQLFEANGTPVGGEILVNTNTSGNQQLPMVAELAGGGFVISWSDSSGVGDTSGSGIKMQLFDSAGATVGGEVLVNTVMTGSQTSPSIAALASGGFAVAWTGAAGGGGGSTFGSIRYQIFDGAGAAVGVEQVASTTATGSFSVPNIAALGTGFLVTWQHTASPADGQGVEIIGQRFDAAGAKLGGEFTVNTTTDGDQRNPDAHALPGGGFIVTWAGDADTGTNVYGQVYDAAGVRVGVEFVLSTNNGGNQLLPRVDVLPSGDILVTWIDSSGVGGDTSGSAVKAQLLTLATAAPTDIALSNASVSETAIDNIPVATLSATGAINTSFTFTIVSDASGGAFRIDGDKLVVDDNLKLDFETQPSVDVRIRASDLNGNSYEETLTLTVTDAAIEAHWSAGEEFTVPVDTAGLQGEPIVTALEDGRFLVVWTPDHGGGLRGRIFEPDGQPAGGDLVLTDFAFGSTYPAVALPGGGFVLTWMGHTAVGDLSLVGQVFDAAGAPVGAKFAIDPSTAAGQHDTALVDSGHFVVVFDCGTPDEPNNPGPYQQVRAQIFDLTGAEVGGDFQVNTTVAGPQRAPQVASLAGGGFVVGWGDGGSDGFGGTDGFMAQIFDAAGAKVGGEIVILPDDGIVGDVYLAGLAAGGFVATWGQLVDEGEPTEHVEFFGQVVDAAGVLVGSAFFIDAVLSNYGNEVRVEALPNGGFVIAWNGISLFGDGDGDAIMAQLYNAAGQRVGDPFLVNQVTREDQVSLSVAVTEAGDLLFTWSDIFHPPGNVDADIKARIFSPVDGSGDIVGTPGPDTLNGTAGDDHILGLGDNDLLNGLGGNDAMEGGAGDDTYFVDAPGDAVIEAASEGRDVVYTSVDYTLGAGQEIEVLSASSHAGTDPLNLTGNSLGQEIWGNAGANSLRGGGGTDYLIGQAGNDTYFVDTASAYVFEAAGGGRDVVYASVNYALLAGQAVEVLSASNHAATTPLSLTGNELGQEIWGNAGANSLRGGGGNDYLIGQGGNDTYFVDTAAALVFESAAGGRDVVYASVSYGLLGGQEIEVLSAASHAATTAIDLTGNELGQEIWGNAGANSLRGGGGNDFLIGQGGNDTYFVDVAAVQVYEAGGGGRDVVYASVNYSLLGGQEVEVLSTASHAATSALDMTGNELAQEIWGNAGANVLDGKLGNDVLIGQGGADTFAFTTALSGTNVDFVADFVAGTDKIALDDAVFTGLALGALPASAFVVGTGAQDADDRIIYNSATGQLYFDADGNGAGLAVQFATLNGHPVIAASDFTVI